MENINVRATFIFGPLGTSPNNETIYRDFIGSKAPDADSLEDEVAALGADAVAETKMTVFPRDEDGNPIDCDSLLKVAENDAGAKAGKVKVKKGTPTGIYQIKIRISAGATEDYKAAKKTIKVSVVVN